MTAKRGWLSVRLVLVAVIAIGLIAASVAAQQQQGPDGIFFEFRGGGTTREPATETLVQVSVANTCVFSDKLVLEKVEICGETGICAKSIEVDRSLNSIFWEKALLDALVKLGSVPRVGLLFLAAVYPLVGKLADKIKPEVFTSGYIQVDLSGIKQPLTYGNIRVIAKATLIRNGNIVTLEREVIVKYLPGF
jgi:hypothetical protein